MSTFHLTMYILSAFLFFIDAFNVEIKTGTKIIKLFSLAFVPLVLTLIW